MCQFEDDDKWVETAMADVNLVADFLLTIKKTSSPHPSSSSPPPLNLHWTVRQRRSNSRTRKMKTDSTRASPTTPLSWSAATSASGADEESSRLTKPVQTSRSKVEEQCEASGNKRLRKKRSLPELLEEERLLLKERGNLKDKVASMHLNLEKQRSNNESLKKMKLDLVSQKNTETARISQVSQKNTEADRISQVSQKNTETARISLVSGKAALDTPQVGDTNHGSSSKLVHPQTVQKKESVVITVGAPSSKLVHPHTVEEKESVVIAEGASSSKLVQPHHTGQEKESAVTTEGASSSVQREIHRENNNRALPFLLPDLNLPPEEQ